MNQLVAEYLPRKNADESDPSADEVATSWGVERLHPHRLEHDQPDRGRAASYVT